jgi:Trk-type K+ transport systems, membrane components
MKKMKRRLSSGLKLVIGFLIIILAGAVLLSLPFSQKPSIKLGFLDALFISTSSVCVTGLTTYNIASTFSIFGRVVLCFLMQLGGIGFAIIAAAFIFLVGKNPAGRGQFLIKDSLGLENNKEITLIARRAIRFSLIIESLGALWLFLTFLRYYDAPLEALGFAIFHAISAYNNAGLDIFGNSLESFRGDISVNLAISSLIILGGLGFIVYSDLMNRRHRRHLMMHTKIVLSTSIALIVIGTLLHYLTGKLSLLESFFLSVSSRTAGFDTVPCDEIPAFSRYITDILMFIGASPGSTGGGIKTTTFFTILLTVISIPRGRQPHAFKRQIDSESISRAFIILGTSMSMMFVALGLLIAIEPSIPLNYLIFEVISAFATVGLSCSVTPFLSVAGKLVIMVLMFIGRLGPLTITGLFQFKPEKIQYLEEHIITG